MPTTHFGTDGNDLIDTRTMPSVGTNDVIDSKGGDDTVILSSGLIYASGPGNDSISAAPGATWVSYAAWGAPAPIRVDLEAGTAQDGYGGQDTVKGISAVHMPNAGGSVVGSKANETVFYFAGKASIDLATGVDRLEMYQLKSSEWSVRQVGDTVTLSRGSDSVSVKNVEEIAFSDVTLRPHYQAEDVLTLVKHLYSFFETEHSTGWWYAGQYNSPQLVGYFPQAALPFDINADGDLDFLVPMNRGYRTGVDSRYHFQVFSNQGGELSFQAPLTTSTPFVAGARRADVIHLARANADALVTVAHDTAIETETRYDIPWRYGDLTITLAHPFQSMADQLTPDNISQASRLTARKTAVDAHSLAVGDINGDGMDDIVVGDFGGVFALLQTAAGPFQKTTNTVFDKLNGWVDPTLPGATPGLLIDLALADFNGDGARDLVVGWGHGTTLSRVFFNDGKGGFTVADSVTLPPSVYGANNNLHMHTFAADFDKDGDQDLVILQSRYDPYYGGNYLQYLNNDGHGRFTDETAQRFGDPTQSPDTFGDRLQWTDNWQTLDINGDGALDIVGKHAVSGQAFYYLNDGKGQFTAHALVTPNGVTPIGWTDLGNDGTLECITFSSTWNDAAGTSGTNAFDLYRVAHVGPPTASRAYDLSGSAGNAALLLGAVLPGKLAFDTSKQALMGATIGLFDQGYALLDLAGALLRLPIWSTLTGQAAASNQDIARYLFTNVNGIAPDTPTLLAATQALSTEAVQGQWLSALAASAANQTHVDLVGLKQTGLDFVG